MFANNETQDKDEDPGFVPPWMLAAGLGAGLASLPYSRRGNRLITAPMLGPRSDRQRMLGDLIQNYAPAALRGVVLRKDSEMGAPMPTEFDYGELTSPELRSLMDQAAANTDAMAPLEGPVGGFEADQGGAPVMIGGRAVVFDETTGKYYDAETGDEMAGYKRGGPVRDDAPDWRGRARSVGQGVAFGWGDEIEAGMRALAQLDPAAYRREVARIRAQQKAYEEANPLESLAYEGGGALATGLIPGMQGATGARLASLAARAPRAARAAAVAGETALYGAGAADSVRDIPRSIRDEAIFAVPMYGAAEAGRAGIGRFRARRAARRGR
jgi:hypothetical protein